MIGACRWPIARYIVCGLSRHRSRGIFFPIASSRGNVAQRNQGRGASGGRIGIFELLREPWNFRTGELEGYFLKESLYGNLNVERRRAASVGSRRPRAPSGDSAYLERHRMLAPRRAGAGAPMAVGVPPGLELRT